MKVQERFHCAHCGMRIKAHEPDVVLTKDGETHYFHTHCAHAAYELASSQPGLWFVAVRHVDEVAN